MKYYQSGSNYIMICEKGESLFDQLLEFAQDSGVKTAWLQGLGAALSLELGYYTVETREYHWRTFDNPPYEITAMQGNIVTDTTTGKPLLHMHGTFSDENFQAFAGHIRHLTVGGTCEIFIETLDTPLTRRHDERSGLATICAMPHVERA